MSLCSACYTAKMKLKILPNGRFTLLLKHSWQLHVQFHTKFSSLGVCVHCVSLCTHFLLMHDTLLAYIAYMQFHKRLAATTVRSIFYNVTPCQQKLSGHSFLILVIGLSFQLHIWHITVSVL